MNEAERNKTKTEQKEEIRKRYKGTDQESIDIIPAKLSANFFNTNEPAEVGVYARVSTGDPHQTSSYELQKNHYQDEVQRRPNWHLVKIYADEGISGTSLNHRKAFKEMIEDCKAHKLNLIITKNVSRFARNIVDCISYVRMLAALDPPVGIYFETERIYTLDDKNEMSLSFLATMAQEESHNKSQSMNTSIEMRFKRGIFLTPKLLGYDLDEEGNLIVNEEEAQIVRLIFFMYLYGYSISSIADQLTALTCKTKKGATIWHTSSISSILQNERHCGDIIARKSFTPNYLNHSSKRNTGEKPMYHQRNHHEPIIDRDDWIAVQKKMRFAKYGNVHYFPLIQIIPTGFLKGYILIHPNWSGFTEENYLNASNLVVCEPNTKPLFRVKGDFDLSNYRAVHREYFIQATSYQLFITNKSVRFSTPTLYKFGEETTVELLFNPHERRLAVRPSLQSSPYCFNWCSIQGNRHYAIKIKGSHFLPVIYKLMNWNSNYQYKATGYYYELDKSKLLIFNLADARMIIKEFIEFTPPTGTEGLNIQPLNKARTFTGYPHNWILGFGPYYYQVKHQIINSPSPYSGIKADVEPITYDDAELNITSEEDISRNITKIIKHIEKSAALEVNNEPT